MPYRSILTLLSLAAFTLSAVPAKPALAQNLVGNPGFERGSFADWSLLGDANHDFVDIGGDLGPTYVPQSGQYFAALGSVGLETTLTQTLSTVAGQTYQVSFWLASDGAVPDNFSASFANQTGFSQENIPVQPYHLYSFLAAATDTKEDLQFAFRNDDGYLSLDTVSVRPASAAPAVPEASTDFFLAFGLLAFCGRAVGIKVWKWAIS